MVSKKNSGSSSSNHQFKTGDIVLAKIKGFPTWPGILVGEEQTPREVLREKPKDKFVIRFFPKADYHFPGAKDLTLLTREECRAYAEDSHRKDGELKAAYRIGAHPDEWLEETDKIVRESERAKDQEELEAQENEDQIQDEDVDAGEDKAQAATKKRSAADDSKSASKAKKPKTEKKAGSAGPRKSAGAAEGDAADSSAGGADSDDPIKKVRAWRHTLQRAFLPKDRKPTEQDVEGQGDMFTVVEKADITAEQLRETKINKVMRKIVGLDKIPLDETYHFRERAEALLVKWHSIEHSKNGADGGEESPAKKEGGGGEGTPAAPTNGETAGANGNAASSNVDKDDVPAPAASAAETSAKADTAEADAPAAATAADETVGDLTEIKEDDATNGAL